MTKKIIYTLGRADIPTGWGLWRKQEAAEVSAAVESRISDYCAARDSPAEKRAIVDAVCVKFKPTEEGGSGLRFVAKDEEESKEQRKCVWKVLTYKQTWEMVRKRFS